LFGGREITSQGRKQKFREKKTKEKEGFFLFSPLKRPFSSLYTRWALKGKVLQ
jgi:hypothetical protein